jgi:hypothetical protein
MADALALAVHEFETYGGGSDPDYQRHVAELIASRGLEQRAGFAGLQETRF